MRRVQEIIEQLEPRALTAESELAKLREQYRWRKYPDEKPETFDDEYLVVTKKHPNDVQTFRYYKHSWWEYLDDDWEIVTTEGYIMLWRPMPTAPDDIPPLLTFLADHTKDEK